MYGQGQQRKAVIEAVRLSESGNKIKISDSDDKLCEESNVIKSCPEDFREKSKKWMKFVAQVSQLMSFEFSLFFFSDTRIIC